MNTNTFKFRNTVLFNISGNRATVISTEIDEFITIEGEMITLLPLLEKGISLNEAVAHFNKEGTDLSIALQEFFIFLQSWNLLESTEHIPTAAFEFKTQMCEARVSVAEQIKYDVYAVESWEPAYEGCI